MGAHIEVRGRQEGISGEHMNVLSKEWHYPGHEGGIMRAVIVPSAHIINKLGVTHKLEVLRSI